MRIPFPRMRRAAAGITAALLAVTALLHAQGTQPAGLPDSAPASVPVSQAPNRINGPIDPSQLQALPNHVPSWATRQNSVGPASSQTMVLTMVLSRSSEQQAALEKLLADQKNPASPEFHHWLNPGEVGARFGLSDSDVEAVKGWIASQGLRVTWVAPSRMFIGFSGLPDAVGRAFGTEVRNYRVNGVERMSVASAPMIPVALAPVVKAIYGLYTIENRPAHSTIAPQQANGPNLTLSDGSNMISPADFNTIYDGPTGPPAPGQTIGIVGRSRVDPLDINYFGYLTSTFLNGATEVVPTAFGGVDPGPAWTAPPPSNVSLEDQSEATLDVTRAGSVDTNAKVLLVVATNASGGIGADAQYLVQTSPVPAQVMSISFGECESEAGPTGVNYWNTLFEQAAVEGISVFVSSGDSGAAGCQQAFTTPSATPPAISPNYICSSSYVTCVGGTEFNDTSNPGQYWGANSQTTLGSAKSYIPEGGWNEPLNSKSAPQLASSGGGVSSVIATPAWQSGPGVPSARSGRYTPDLSFSSSCHDPYFGCMAAAGASCVPDSTGAFSFVGFCGTSAAAPSMAGVAALLNTKLGFPQGNINPEIYSMAQNQPTSFHDATPATSGVVSCDINTPSMCNNSAAGPTGLSGGQAGYSLTAGYDLVTGLGSADIQNFLNNFHSALPAPTVTVTPPATAVTAGQSFAVNIAISGGSGQPAPTGTVQMTASSSLNSVTYNLGQATLASGAAMITVPGATLPLDFDNLAPYTLTATYSPDDGSSAIYARAIGSAEVNFAPIATTFAMTSSPSNPTTAQDLQISVAVSGGAGNSAPTGSLAIWAPLAPTWTDKVTLSNGSASVTIPAGVLPSGAELIEADYYPDEQGRQLYAQNHDTETVNITQSPKTTPTMTVTLSASTVSFEAPLTVAVKVTPVAGGPMPTGSIVLVQGNSDLQASLTNGSASFAVPDGYLPVGVVNFSVSYSGDSNNEPVSASTSVTVTKGTPILTITTFQNSITPADSLSVSIGVSGADPAPPPSGTVTITSGSYTSAVTTLRGGNINITIPAGSLAVGTDVLTVTYSGDSNFTSTTGTSTITVVQPPPSFTIFGTPVTISAPGSNIGNTSTITITPAWGFTGSVTLTAAITTSPAGAQDLPTLSFGSTSPANVSGPGGATATLTVSTTAATTGALHRPARPGGNWYAAGETALACLLLFGLPVRRRRRWSSYLGVLFLLIAISTGVSACGGGGGGSSPTPPTNPGTTLGTYVVTIKGTSGSLTAPNTLNVTVQ